MHLQHPVAQAVHDELQNARMLQVQCVARAGKVHVVPRVIRQESVVRGVIDAAEGEGGAHLVAFGRVVVHDIENHLDSCRVQRLHHRLEFADAPDRGIAHIGCEEADGVVTPVVA